LRKDFPVSGFKEVQFTDLEKQIVYKELELSQRYRLMGQVPV
jgi:NADH:ubiquinone oxidoreductase subunit C